VGSASTRPGNSTIFRGARPHGHNALQLIEHLYPNEDATTWARDWFARHPGNGSFVAGDGEPVDEFAEVEAMAYVEALYNGAASIDDGPGQTYITKPRGLPCAPKIKPSCAGSPTIATMKARCSLRSPTTMTSWSS
jgi:hypothetical protein